MSVDLPIALHHLGGFRNNARFRLSLGQFWFGSTVTLANQRNGEEKKFSLYRIRL